MLIFADYGGGGNENSDFCIWSLLGAESGEKICRKKGYDLKNYVRNGSFFPTTAIIWGKFVSFVIWLLKYYSIFEGPLEGFCYF